MICCKAAPPDYFASKLLGGGGSVVVKCFLVAFVCPVLSCGNPGLGLVTV